MDVTDQVRIARLDFVAELHLVRSSLVSMVDTATRAIGLATVALLHGDLGSALQVEELELGIQDERVLTEQRNFQVLARQQPVAGDLRALVAGIHASANSHRMSTLAHHIAAAAARAHPAAAVPAELHALFQQMGQVAVRVADGARVTLETRDSADAARMDVDDDVMDRLRGELFTALVGDWRHSVDSAINAALVGRYYERFADHAVAICQSVIFEVHGDRETTGTTTAGAAASHGLDE